MATSPETSSTPSPALIQQLLDALDALSGLHPGFRPAHAKGLMCSGTFTPSPEAVQLTRAPHVTRPSTPVIVRFSDSAGVACWPGDSGKRPGRCSGIGGILRAVLIRRAAQPRPPSWPLL